VASIVSAEVVVQWSIQHFHSDLSQSHDAARHFNGGAAYTRNPETGGNSGWINRFLPILRRRPKTSKDLAPGCVCGSRDEPCCVCPTLPTPR
jgi:hypothetical protein